jgi:hypothetical protein
VQLERLLMPYLSVLSPGPRQLCSMWVLLAWFDAPLPPSATLEGAFVEGVPELSWVANNVPKLKQEALAGSGGAWTIGEDPEPLALSFVVFAGESGIICQGLVFGRVGVR